MKKTSIILFFLFSLLLSQNQNTYIWSGTSITTSDNLDALNLNPAGLGFNRVCEDISIINNIKNKNFLFRKCKIIMK